MAVASKVLITVSTLACHDHAIGVDADGILESRLDVSDLYQLAGPSADTLDLIRNVVDDELTADVLGNALHDEQDNQRDNPAHQSQCDEPDEEADDPGKEREVDIRRAGVGLDFLGAVR